MPSPPVDDSTQALEQFRRPLNLVQDHQLVFMIGKVADWVRQFDPVGLVLKVQIDRSPCFSHLQSKRRLANLSRSQQDNRRRMSERVIDVCAKASWQHSCNYGAYLQICKSLFLN